MPSLPTSRPPPTAAAVLYLGTNHLAYPAALFSVALADVPFVPLNYRLGEQQLSRLKCRHPAGIG